MPVQIVGLFNDFKLGPGMALSMLMVGIVTLALILLRFLPWSISRLRQRASRKKVTYVLTD
jgi:iron(III) transport system permease protein